MFLNTGISTRADSLLLAHIAFRHCCICLTLPWQPFLKQLYSYTVSICRVMACSHCVILQTEYLQWDEIHTERKANLISWLSFCYSLEEIPFCDHSNENYLVSSAGVHFALFPKQEINLIRIIVLYFGTSGVDYEQSCFSQSVESTCGEWRTLSHEGRLCTRYSRYLALL